MSPPFLLLLTGAGLVAAGAAWRAAGRRLGLPPAVSLLALGVALGPAGFDLLPPAWLEARTPLSAAAFVVLLLRAGLGISPDTLRRIAPAALLLGTGPVLVEAGVFTMLARALLFESWTMSALAGFLVAAVSPAVILPAMLAHKDAGLGGPRHVPDLIMGQTLVNSVLAPVVILGLLGAVTSATPGLTTALPLAALALLAGGILGVGAAGVLRIDRLGRRPKLSAASLLAAGLLLHFGCARTPWIEGIVAVLALAVATRRRLGDEPRALRDALRHVWGVGEILLFTNLGSAIQLGALGEGRFLGIALGMLAVALAARIAVAHGLSSATLTRDERRYVALAHVPKATIQAVFGAVPLLTFERIRPDLVPLGEALLLLAVLAIVATAPLGAMVLQRAPGTLEAESATRQPRGAMAASRGPASMGTMSGATPSASRTRGMTSIVRHPDESVSAHST